MDLRVGLLPHPHLQRNLAFQWGYRTLQALTYPGHLKTMKGLATLLVRFPGPSIHVLQCKEQMGAWAQPASFLHWHLSPVANSFGGPARPSTSSMSLLWLTEKIQKFKRNHKVLLTLVYFQIQLLFL